MRGTGTAARARRSKGFPLMAKKRMAKAKTVNYVLIPRTARSAGRCTSGCIAIVDAHHEDLSKTNARIALAWQLGLKPDVDGRLVLGRCRKATDLDRELVRRSIS
jgi:hypothetical protein